MNEPPPAELLRRLTPIPTYRDHPATTPHNVAGVDPSGAPLHVPILERAEPMLRLADLLDAEAPTVARVMTTEMGKTLAAAEGEPLLAVVGEDVGARPVAGERRLRVVGRAALVPRQFVLVAVHDLLEPVPLRAGEVLDQTGGRPP